jgi:cyanophycinase
MAGGPEALIVYVPTAEGRASYDAAYQESAFRAFRAQGAVNLRLVHTADRKEADTEEFVKPIREARAVFFGGGRQWRLADAYLGTRAEQAFREVLDRGGVIAGTSAGATIQGSFLVRGDTKGNEILIGDHTEGFAYLKDVAIDQHLLRRKRQFDLLEVVRAKPHLLGIGIDEDTAIVVRGDVLEVAGASFVAIYDPKSLAAESKFLLLQDGERFDLAARSQVAVQRARLGRFGRTR